MSFQDSDAERRVGRMQWVTDRERATWITMRRLQRCVRCDHDEFDHVLRTWDCIFLGCKCEQFLAQSTLREFDQRSKPDGGQLGH